MDVPESVISFIIDENINSGNDVVREEEIVERGAGRQ